MVQAAAMIGKEPIALQLRYLQTMREIASEHNTTTFLPMPIDLFSRVFEEIILAKFARLFDNWLSIVKNTSCLFTNTNSAKATARCAAESLR